jgi:carbohydrate kinase (thermoresistant glucokinase family)
LLVSYICNLSSSKRDVLTQLCFTGAHNLMLLCIASHRPCPAAFNFCSSVSAVASTPGGFVPEALPTSLTYAQGMGYAQSKLVTEYLVQRAGIETEMHARVLRVGQVIADTQHGIWNDKEAIPMMLQAGITIGAIPALDESPLWLPVDVVAQTVTEISLSDAPAGVMNVVSHQPFHWTRDLLPKLRATGLQFEEVGQREWIKRLRASNPDPVANPPIRLVEFFAKKYDNDKKRKGLHYDTSFARWLSPALATAPGLDQDIVGKFVKHFLSTAWASSDLNDRKNDLAKRKLVVVAGPCGSGKSTIAKVIAENFGSTWVEGDELHDEAALAKMKAGVALTDADRWDWLTRLKTRALNLFFDPDAELGPTLNGVRQGAQAVIVTCSALKREYRDALRNIGVHGNVETVFIMLQVGSKEELEDRLSRREGHYMKPVMVEGQIRALEEVGIDEVDVVPVDTMRGQEEVNRKIVTVLEEVLG